MTQNGKRKAGRPPKRKPPAQIPDTAENIVKAVVKTRSEAERKMLQERGDKAAQ